MSKYKALPYFIRSYIRQRRERIREQSDAEDRIKQIHEHYAEANKDFDPTNEAHRYYYGEEELGGPESVLEWHKTRPLVQKASRLGVTIPSEWWTTRQENPWIEKGYLDSNSRAKLQKLIKEARFTHFKKWVDVLAPIIGALTGIIGALIGLIALLKESN